MGVMQLALLLTLAPDFVCSMPLKKSQFPVARQAKARSERRGVRHRFPAIGSTIDGTILHTHRVKKVKTKKIDTVKYTFPQHVFCLQYKVRKIMKT